MSAERADESTDETDTPTLYLTPGRRVTSNVDIHVIEYQMAHAEGIRGRNWATTFSPRVARAARDRIRAWDAKRQRQAAADGDGDDGTDPTCPECSADAAETGPAPVVNGMLSYDDLLDADDVKGADVTLARCPDGHVWNPDADADADADTETEGDE